MYPTIHTEYIDDNSMHSEILAVHMAVHLSGAVTITLTQQKSMEIDESVKADVTQPTEIEEHGLPLVSGPIRPLSLLC